MRARTRYAREADVERHVGDFIPYSAHVSRHAVSTYDGELVATWRVAGIPWETAEPEEIRARMEQMHGALRSVGSPHVAIWQHTARRRVEETLDGSIAEPWCAALDDRYRESLRAVGQMRTEHFVSVVYRPDPTAVGRVFARVGRRREALIAERAEALAALEDIRRRFGAALAPYMAEALGTYVDERAGLCSSLLSFLAFVLTGRWQTIRVPRAPLDRALASAWVFAGTETLEIRTPTEKRYAQCLDFTDYPEETKPDMLDPLLHSTGELLITQSFAFIGKQKAREQLKRHRVQLENANDDSTTELRGLNDALDELTQGKFVMGGYHFSLMLYGESVEEVREQVAEAATEIDNQGLVATLASTALDAAYYAQLPANFLYRPRVEFITSRNFASLAPLHGFINGRADGNPWGQAVTMFQVMSGEPFYFSFHVEGDRPDEFGETLRANTRIIGASGEGKTALQNFLAAQSFRFADERMAMVFLDKDRSSWLFVEAVCGKYHEIREGVDTGWSPMQLEPTRSNIAFLGRLLATLARRGGASFSVEDERRLSDAVDAVMKMPREYRRLSTLLQNITESRHDRESSLVRRLARWCADDGTGKRGPLAWVFDCPEDTIDLSTHRVYGFDGTSFLEGDPEVRAAISMYLLHRIDQAMDGRRFIYWVGEAGEWFADAPVAPGAVETENTIRTFAGKKQTSIRKRNGFGVFETQMPSQFLQTPIARALIEQTPTEIYLPNPLADHDEYVHGFGLTESEYRIVRELPEQSRTFLVKKKFRNRGRRSVIARLDLTGFDDELAVLAGTTENIALADRAIEEVGDDPAAWLPLYHRLRRERDDAAQITRGDRHADATHRTDRRAVLDGADRHRADPDDGRRGDRSVGSRTPHHVGEMEDAV